MSRADLLTAVRETLAVVLEVDPVAVTAGAQLSRDLGADSIAVIHMADLLEQRLDPDGRQGASARLRIEDVELVRLASVGDVVDYLAARL